MTIKTLLGMTSNNRNSGNSGSNWTFGWTSSQASVLSANTGAKAVKRGVSQADRQVGMYGVLATRGVSGR